MAAPILAAITNDQITDLRENWIRDEWIDSPTFAGLSHWNKANRREFFDEEQILALDAYVRTEWKLELQQVWTERFTVRVNAGDVSADATTDADAEQNYARYRLLRAECFERQMNDPGFRKSLAEEPETLANMAAQVLKDRNFVMRRKGIAILPMARG